MRFTFRKMRLTRLLVLGTVLLAFTGQGFTAAAQIRGCQSQMAQAESKSEQPNAMPGDCCPSAKHLNAACDLAAKAHHPDKHDPCSACKAGYNCKSPQTYQPAQVLMMLMAPPQSAVSAPPSISPPSHSPDGLWRPPAHI